MLSNNLKKNTFKTFLKRFLKRFYLILYWKKSKKSIYGLEFSSSIFTNASAYRFFVQP